MLTYKTESHLISDTVEDLFNPYIVGARPFLKWAGGKGQLLDKFQGLYPKVEFHSLAGDYTGQTIGDKCTLLAVSKVLEISHKNLVGPLESCYSLQALA